MWFRKKYRGQVVRSKKKTKKSSGKKIYFFIFVFLILYGVFFLNYDPPKKNSSLTTPRIILSDEIIQKKIEEHSRQLRFKRKLARDANFFKAKTLGISDNEILDKSIVDEEFVSQDGVDLSQEQLFKELISSMEAKEDNYDDIEDRIARYKHIEKKLKYYKKIKTKNEVEIFIQKFLENAEKAGYSVQLNENLDVVSVVEIKKD